MCVFFLIFNFDMKNRCKLRSFTVIFLIGNKKSVITKKNCAVESIRALLMLSQASFFLSFQHMKNSQWNFLICCLNIAILLLRLIDAFLFFFISKTNHAHRYHWNFFFLLCSTFHVYFSRYVICLTSNKRYIIFQMNSQIPIYFLCT